MKTSKVPRLRSERPGRIHQGEELQAEREFAGVVERLVQVDGEVVDRARLAHGALQAARQPAVVDLGKRVAQQVEDQSASTGSSRWSSVAKAAKASISRPTRASAPGRSARRRPRPGNEAQPAQPVQPRAARIRRVSGAVGHAWHACQMRADAASRAKADCGSDGWFCCSRPAPCYAPSQAADALPPEFNPAMSDSPESNRSPQKPGPRGSGDAGGFNWRLLVLFSIALVILVLAFVSPARAVRRARADLRRSSARPGTRAG